MNMSTGNAYSVEFQIKTSWTSAGPVKRLGHLEGSGKSIRAAGSVVYAASVIMKEQRYAGTVHPQTDPPDLSHSAGFVSDAEPPIVSLKHDVRTVRGYQLGGCALSSTHLKPPKIPFRDQP